MFIHNYQINETIVANMVNLTDLPHVKDIKKYHTNNNVGRGNSLGQRKLKH